MMPYDSYRLYQIERPKNLAEIRRADEQAAQSVSAVSSLLRGFTWPVRQLAAAVPSGLGRRRGQFQLDGDLAVADPALIKPPQRVVQVIVEAGAEAEVVTAGPVGHATGKDLERLAC
jgi:hypothetical protein